MFLVFVALYDEAYALLKKFSFRRQNQLSLYEGVLASQKTMICLTGPGIKKPNKITNLLQELSFSYIINIGFAGALHQGLCPGDIFFINRFYSPGKKELFASKNLGQILELKKASLLTYHTLLRDPSERAEFYDNFGTELVDMEGYHLQYLCKKLNLEKQFLSIKVVGDALTETNYLLWEENFRPFFRQKKIWQKIKTILKTGIHPSLYVWQRKRFLQNTLKNALENTIHKLAYH